MEWKPGDIKILFVGEATVTTQLRVPGWIFWWWPWQRGRLQEAVENWLSRDAWQNPALSEWRSVSSSSSYSRGTLRPAWHHCLHSLHGIVVVQAVLAQIKFSNDPVPHSDWRRWWERWVWQPVCSHYHLASSPGYSHSENKVPWHLHAIQYTYALFSYSSSSSQHEKLAMWPCW